MNLLLYVSEVVMMFATESFESWRNVECEAKMVTVSNCGLKLHVDSVSLISSNSNLQKNIMLVGLELS